MVGIVRDVRERELSTSGTASLYLPLAQAPWPAAAVVVRTRLSAPEALASSLVQTVRALDRDLPIVDVMAMDMVVSRSMSDRQLTMYFLASFAAFALVSRRLVSTASLRTGFVVACARLGSGLRSARTGGASCGWWSPTRCGPRSSALSSALRRRSRWAASCRACCSE